MCELIINFFFFCFVFFPLQRWIRQIRNHWRRCNRWTMIWWACSTISLYQCHSLSGTLEPALRHQMCHHPAWPAATKRLQLPIISQTLHQLQLQPRPPPRTFSGLWVPAAGTTCQAFAKAYELIWSFPERIFFFKKKKLIPWQRLVRTSLIRVLVVWL